MKTSMLGFGMLALVAACLLNGLVNTGCVTKPEQSSFKLEGLERALGPECDSPVLY